MQLGSCNLHPLSVSMKPLDVAGGLDEHFCGFILPEGKLLRECTNGIGNKSLLVHPLSLSLLHNGLHFLF
jgi:hypothetical protein